MFRTSPTTSQNPLQTTFLDKKPPLLPRQSTSDVLSFTRIIANRLQPGQTVWEYFSPPAVAARAAAAGSANAAAAAANSATTNASSSPTSSSVSAASSLPPPPTAPAVNENKNKRLSLLIGTTVTRQGDYTNSTTTTDNATESSAPSSPPSPSSSPSSTVLSFKDGQQPLCLSPTSTLSPSSLFSNTSTALPSPASPPPTPTTSKAQKRKSFAQSLRGMLSFGSLLSPTTPVKEVEPTAVINNTLDKSTDSPGHYNILVLGSDSAPLASTLYKMSSLLPNTSKIGHYQEISGFFVAYFQSTPTLPSLSDTATAATANKSLATKTSTTTTTLSIEKEVSSLEVRRVSLSSVASSSSCSTMISPVAAPFSSSTTTVTASTTTTMAATGNDEVKTRHYNSLQGRADEDLVLPEMQNMLISQEYLHDDDDGHNNSDNTIGSRPLLRTDSSGAASIHSIDSTVSSATTVLDLVRHEVSSSTSSSSSSNTDSDNEEDQINTQSARGETASLAETLKPTNIQTSSQEQENQRQKDEEEEYTLPDDHHRNASISVHAFSLDTTWPVPRIMAQTFWFPFAHGIIYIVDATRKNDPRGMDHLLNAKFFLASLINDPHFGMLKRHYQIPIVIFANKAGLDDETCFRLDEVAEILGCDEWDHQCQVVSSADGGEGRNSTSSRNSTGSGNSGMMDPQVQAQMMAQKSMAERPWCIKSTRSDGSGEGLQESVEWLKARMSECRAAAAAGSS